MTGFKNIFFLCIALPFQSLFAADLPTDHIGIMLGGTEIFPDEGLTLKNQTLNLNYELTGQTFNYRLDLEHVKVRNDPNNKVSSLTRPSLNLKYKFNPKDSAQTYILGGLGYESVSGARPGFESHPFGQIGLGVDIHLTPKLSLAAEYKQIHIIGGDAEESRENVLLLGLRFATNPTVKSTFKDSDFDGVDDSIDRCPATPNIFSVSPDGCPAKVNLGVTFVTNSTEILNYYQSKIQTFAIFLKASPNYRVVIEGHTDNVGNDTSNLLLSRRRAIAVASQLVALGVNPSSLITLGKGESTPVASNASDAGRALNRRVVAILHRQSQNRGAQR